LTVDAFEALRMPALLHSIDHTPNNELAAFSTARGVECLEIILAVMAAVILEEWIVFERTKALHTPGETKQITHVRD
jgi:hypothetical protein